METTTREDARPYLDAACRELDALTDRLRFGTPGWTHAAAAWMAAEEARRAVEPRPPTAWYRDGYDDGLAGRPPRTPDDPIPERVRYRRGYVAGARERMARPTMVA